MKYNISVICTALASMLLFSCSSEKAGIHDAEESTVTTVQESQVSCPVTTVTEAAAESVTEPEVTLPADPYYPVLPVKKDELPSLTSSSAVLNFYNSIFTKLCGTISINHFPYKRAFNYFLSGNDELFISESLTGSELQEAENAGIHLNSVHVARKALVFMVNKANPVNSLTSEQIRGIYSGEITNWSEVGGNDEEIKVHQYEKNSENYDDMEKFMGDCDFPDAAIHTMVPYYSRRALMRNPDQYTNEINTIGYTVYSDAVLLSKYSDFLKVISVDGIAPAEKTIKDGTYPLSDSIVITYRDNPQEKTERFINWILSEAGQKCVQESGYFPVNDIEAPAFDKLYEPKGTGKKMPENYAPSKKVSVISGENPGDFSFIKNEKLREMIRKDVTGYRASVPSGEEISDEGVTFYGENGYITFHKVFSVRSSHGVYEKARYFTYDLTGNKRIEKYSDLFFENSEFVPYLNKAVTYNNTHTDNGSHDYDHRFLGITGDITNFSVEGIEITGKNNNYWDQKYPYIFRENTGSYAASMLPLVMVTGEYHDFNSYISTESISSECEFEISEKNLNEWYCQHELKSYIRNNFTSYDSVTGSLFHTESEVKQRNSVINKIIVNFRDKFGLYEPEEENKPQSPPVGYGMDFYHADEIYKVTPDCTCESSEYYTPTDYYMNILTLFMDDNDHYNNMFNKNALFDHHYAGYDPETGEPLTFADVFGPEFSDIDENYAFFTYSVSSLPDGSDCVKFYYGAPFDEGYEEQTVVIPVVREHLNMKYFIHADDAWLTENDITNQKIYDELINYVLP